MLQAANTDLYNPLVTKSTISFTYKASKSQFKSYIGGFLHSAPTNGLLWIFRARLRGHGYLHGEQRLRQPPAPAAARQPAPPRARAQRPAAAGRGEQVQHQEVFGGQGQGLYAGNLSG